MSHKKRTLLLHMQKQGTDPATWLKSVLIALTSGECRTWKKVVVGEVYHCTLAIVHSEYGITTIFHNHLVQISVNAFLAPSGIDRSLKQRDRYVIIGHRIEKTDVLPWVIC